MATFGTLCDRQALFRLGGGLEPGEQPMRLLFAFPHVVDWLANVMGDLPPDLSGGRQSPLEQVDDLLHDFVSGADLSYYRRTHSMEPWEEGVWELKTPDIRLFGWFHVRDTFIVANVDTAERCKSIGLYEGYRADTIRRRIRLDIDEPKFISGGYNHVF